MEQDYGILTHRTLIAEWKRLLREANATHVEVDLDELEFGLIEETRNHYGRVDITRPQLQVLEDFNHDRWWWNEETFDIAAAPLYVQQAYEARKFAFVSDYVRLWALEKFGGLYMDVDFMVYRPFDELMTQYSAFAGYEGSKRNPVMQGVIASEAHGAWVKDMLCTYDTRVFIKEDGILDMTPNTSYFSDRLESQGFNPDGKEKDVFVKGEFFLHVFPVHYFCPVLTTGEDVRTEETYCEHKGESSWAQKNWKGRLLQKMSPALRTKLILLKRKLLG